MAVPAELSFEFSGNSDIISHPDPPGEIHVSVGSWKVMGICFFLGEVKENVDSLLCYVNHFLGSSAAPAPGH